MVRLIVALVLALVFANTSFAQDCKCPKANTKGVVIQPPIVLPQGGCQGPSCTNGSCKGSCGSCTSGSCSSSKSSFSYSFSSSSGTKRGLFGRIRGR